MKPALRLCALLAALAGLAPAHGAPLGLDKPLLFEEGSFQLGTTANGSPVGWTINPGNYKSFDMSFLLPSSEGNKYAKLINNDITQIFRLMTEIDLPPGKGRTLRISARLKVTDLVQDPATEWASAQIGFDMRDVSGKWDWRGTTPLRLQSSTRDWIDREVIFKIPDTVTGLRVMPGLYKATGTLEIDDIQVYVE